MLSEQIKELIGKTGQSVLDAERTDGPVTSVFISVGTVLKGNCR